MPNIHEIFSISAERVADTRKAYLEAQTTVANAKAFGTAAHVSAAQAAFRDAAEVYAMALKTHAHVVVDYTTEMTKGTP